MPADRIPLGRANRTLVTLATSGPRFVALQRGQWRRPEARRVRARRRIEETLSAARRIPFYADRLPRELRWDELASLPELTRTDVPLLHDSLLATRPEAHRAPTVRTSGSSGSPIPLRFDTRHQRGRFAARALYLWENGWRPHHRSAWLLSILPGSPDGDLTRSRALGGARFFPHSHDFERQIEWLERVDPVHLYSMPSNLDGLLHLMEERGTRLPSLATIFTGGEVLEDHLRERAQRVLGVPIADDYGTTEAFLAWQCPTGSYHVNDEHVWIEIVTDEGQPAAPGTVGRVLFTTLENRLMPLVRYAIDDYAEAVSGPCPCGRTLPRIGRIHGRGMNLFRKADGSFLSPWRLVDPVHGLPGLVQCQVVQHAFDHFTVRFVAREPPAAEKVDAIRTLLVERLGDAAKFSFERVEEIPRTARGKFMSAVCEISRP